MNPLEVWTWTPLLECVFHRQGSYPTLPPDPHPLPTTTTSLNQPELHRPIIAVLPAFQLRPPCPLGPDWTTHHLDQSQGVRTNLMSAVSAKGQLRFMVTPDRMTALVFVEFLRRLIHNQERPVFLIVDNHSTHRARIANDFVVKTSGRLRLFYLPSYSPVAEPGRVGVAPREEPSAGTSGDHRTAAVSPAGAHRSPPSAETDVSDPWLLLRPRPPLHPLICRLANARISKHDVNSLQLSTAVPVC